MIRIRQGIAGAKSAADAGDVVVMVDALRASVTLAAMIERGVEEILVCNSLQAAEEIRDHLSEPIIVGEWQNKVPDWFDFDNSPTTLLQYDFTGRSVLFLSSNGARMLVACKDASEVLVGGVVNGMAAMSASRAAATGCDISIIAAGDGDQPADEDDASAAILAEICGPDIDPLQEVEKQLWLTRISEHSLAGIFNQASHGRYLVEKGKSQDVAFCCLPDELRSVPRVKEFRQLVGHTVSVLGSIAQPNLGID